MIWTPLDLFVDLLGGGIDETKSLNSCDYDKNIIEPTYWTYIEIKLINTMLYRF